MRRLLLIPFLLWTASALAAGAPVALDGGDTLTVATDVSVDTSATLIATADSSRAFLNCYTTADVRWGPSTITTTKGMLLPSGTPFSTTSKAAVYMIALTDTATVSCTQESFSTSSSGGPIFSP